MLSARPMWMVSRHGIGRRGLIGRPSGGHRAILLLNMFNIARRRRPIGSRTCTTQLRVVINKTLSPYQPGSRTILYDSLVPTDANGHIARHSANVNGVPRADATSDGFVPNCLRLHRSPIGASDRLIIMWSGHEIESVSCTVITFTRIYKKVVSFEKTIRSDTFLYDQSFRSQRWARFS